MSEPRDPLQHQTLATPVEERIGSLVPEAYRLVYRKYSGSYRLQGAFKSWNEQGILFYEWRDIPTVIED